MKNWKKGNKYLVLLVLLLVVTIGYALISTTLKMNGVANITKHTWNIYWDNISNIDKSDTAVVVSEASINESNTTQVDFSVNFNEFNDYYEFTVDAVNAGDIDAMVNNIEVKINDVNVLDEQSEIPDYIKYTVTYADDKEILKNHLLPKKNGDTNTVQSYKFRIEYDADSLTAMDLREMPSSGSSYTFSFKITYSQATNEAIEVDED